MYEIKIKNKFRMTLNQFVKEKRKSADLTQPELAEKAGVGLRFIRDLEQGKESLRLDKVNQVLKFFGFQVGAVPLNKDTMRQAEIKIYDKIAGRLTQDENGYNFSQTVFLRHWVYP